MEFPNLGEHCHEKSCGMLDFLPFRCDCCSKVFCKEHIKYENHKCDSQKASNRDFQVPLCPLCGQPVPYKRTEQPDIAMSAHIDRDCQSDPAEDRRKKIFTNRCFKKGCKQKELIPFNCQKCKRNYCIRHRLEVDHDCDSISSNTPAQNSRELNDRRLAFFQKQQQQQQKPQAQQANRAQSSRTSDLNRNMSESEALEYAIRISKMDSQKTEKRANANEDEDEMLARAIAESESEYNRQRNEEKKDNCSIS